jgi:PGF-pre-PGF domain-containing protein
MKNLKTAALAIIFLCLFFPIIQVRAQYGSDVIPPVIQNGTEVFGVSTQTEKTLSFYPEGCKSIDRIMINFKANVDGQLTVKSDGTTSPISDKKIDQVYEYCELQFSNITQDNIISITIDSKVRKSWLSSTNVDQTNIALYTYTNNNWQNNTTQKTKDDSLYVYYTSNNLPFSQYIALGEFKPASSNIFGISPLLLVVCCIFILFLILLLSVIYAARRRNQQQ